MIPSGVQVFVALEPVDMRWSFDRLAGARGFFRLPETSALDARHVELDESLLDALLDGVDLGEAPKSAPRRRRVH